MKRVILALSGLFLAAGLCMAQSWQARQQIGAATQELKTEGLSAAHCKIPIGSKAKVTNPANGLEIEVTITARIPESSQRIIDLSPGAARALDISPGSPVIVASLSQQNPSENSDKSASEVELQMGKQPFYITINNYIINSGKPVPPGKKQESTDLAGYDVKTGPDNPDYGDMTPEVVVLPLDQLPTDEEPASPAAQAQPPTQPETAAAALPTAPPGKPPLFTSPPVYDPQIIPGLPNPNTDKVYRLLVGTYPGVDSAFPVYKQLQAAGFDVVQEQAGDMCKVFAAGIPASRVYYAAKRLGAIGFQQIWIQE